MQHTLVINPIACDGKGLCVELFPERLQFDDWGFPIVDAQPFEDDLMKHAKRACKACPVKALSISSAL